MNIKQISYADGYTSGFYHCEDFEGISDGDAEKFAAQFIAEWKADPSLMGEVYESESYCRGFIDGLKDMARHNAERYARDYAEWNDQMFAENRAGSL